MTIMLLKDCMEHDCIYGFLVFKGKVSARDVQDDICRIKNELYETGICDWTIEDDILPKLYDLYDCEYFDYDEIDNEVNC